MTLPPPNESLRMAYLTLVNDIDLQVQALTRDRFTNRLRCGPGCSSCCQQFSVLPLEAALIAETLERKRKKALPPESNQCPLLIDDFCLIYPARPIICRTQGVPIAYIDEMSESIEVSACPLNFSDDYPLSHEDLFLLDPFNRRLAELNRRYCRAAGLNPDTRLSIKTLVDAVA